MYGTCLAELGPELHFATYYSDNMVLQRAPQRAVVWGYGPLITENTSVTLRVEGQGRRLEYNTVIKNTGLLIGKRSSTVWVSAEMLMTGRLCRSVHCMVGVPLHMPEKLVSGCRPSLLEPEILTLK